MSAVVIPASLSGRKAISLFTGAGGLDIGFERAGFEVILANDIDRDACRTYRKNHPGRAVVEGPLAQALSVLHHVSGVDAVFGGAPCQGFSVAGKMDPLDPRNRLVLDFMDAVGSVRPKMFVLENVKSLAVNSKWQAVRTALADKAQNFGYSAAMVVLCASHYGVPQQRERMFFIGFQEDLAGAANGIVLHKLIEEALRPLRRKPETLRNIIKRIGRAGTPGNPWGALAKITYAKSPVLRASAYAGMLFNGAGRPLSPDGFSCTLPASMGGNKTPIIDEALFFDGADSFVERYHSELMAGGKARSGTAPSRLRRMTVREAKALTTFPEEYILIGENVAQYRQIGNAVPCELAQAVGEASFRLLNKFENEKKVLKSDKFSVRV